MKTTLFSAWLPPATRSRGTSAVCLLAGLLIPLASATSLAAAELPVIESLSVQPAEAVLTHPRHIQSLLVTGQTADGRRIDLTSQADFSSSSRQVAEVSPLGHVLPAGSGESTITVSAAGRTAAVRIQVQLPQERPPYSFTHEVMPVLSRAGCNSGACHGYSLGKNGFKLSLRGADAAADVGSLTEEFLQRRINPHQPEASLLLTKPLGDVPHKGGVRFEKNSLLYENLLGWVRDGAPDDVAEAVALESIEIYPKKVVLEPGRQQQLQLLARYADGTVRDVTRLAVFTVNTERIAETTDDGLVTATALGETAVSGRFERIFATAGFIVQKHDPTFDPTPVPAGNVADLHVIRKLNELNIRPSVLADDATFLRRVYLDLIGIQPTPDEITAFLASSQPDKRAAVVEELFLRPEFVDQWSLKWGDLLQVSRDRLSQPAVFAFREWIRGAVSSNMPLDELARAVLTGQGGFADDPTAAFLAFSADTDDTLQRATQVFCGVRMLCAKCHPHPFENWTQGDYYGLHSFFNQVSTKADPRLPGVKNARSVLVNPAAGYSRNPRTGQLQPPRFLGGTEPELPPNTDRRLAYADWLTSPENPYFARSLANRFWSYFFHRGIIDPVDDLRTTNPPVNPELLDALTGTLVENQFDIRQLMRTIVTSNTYQRSSVPNDSNREDNMNFSRAVPRRVPAEALLDSIVQATGVPERFAGAPVGFTAAQLPDATVRSEFLDLFGKPQRMEACECERDDGSNMLQALHFINGKSILSRVADPRGRVAQLLGQKLTDEELVQHLYLWAIARPATAEETALGTATITAYGDQRKEAAEDILWALLNSRDFLLVH